MSIQESRAGGYAEYMGNLLTITDIRRANLLKLIDKYGGGQKKRFGEIAGMDPGHVSQICNGVRGMGDHVARKLEETLTLGKGWMDVARQEGEAVIKNSAVAQGFAQLAAAFDNTDLSETEQAAVGQALVIYLRSRDPQVRATIVQQITMLAARLHRHRPPGPPEQHDA